MLILTLETTKREQFIDITYKVREAIETKKFRDGIVQIFIPHTTAGVTVNEFADSDVPIDILKSLSDLIPESSEFKHFEGNSDSHIKTLLTGVSCSFPVEDGKLLLGRWQGIFFCEYDGPRSREYWLKFLGEFYR